MRLSHIACGVVAYAGCSCLAIQIFEVHNVTHHSNPLGCGAATASRARRRATRYHSEQTFRSPINFTLCMRDVNQSPQENKRCSNALGRSMPVLRDARKEETPTFRNNSRHKPVSVLVVTEHPHRSPTPVVDDMSLCQTSVPCKSG